ncbi:MAG: PD-(D/E)XK nuclease family protein [Bacteroidota bacterium]
MSSFLEIIARDLKKKHGDHLSELCLVVPTRRAKYFLQDILAQVYQKTIWAPEIVSIQDFVRSWSGQQFPEIMPLVFELYQVYQKRMAGDSFYEKESFDQFYSWGEMLVKDFDELDKYCVNAEELFTNVKDLKEIDLFFTLQDDNLTSIRDFWRTIRGRDEGPTEVQQKFLRIWEVLFDIYEDFRSSLRGRNMAYDGMAYRRLAHHLESEAYPFAYREIVFIGFNALSKAEERIMEALLKMGKGRVYWDVDDTYLNPDPADLNRKEPQGLVLGPEPGKFIREYYQKWRNLEVELVMHQMIRSPKQIHITGVPLQIGQAQYLGNLLRQDPPKVEDYRQTALVLADEHLLFPVLYALPEQIQNLNITMGYPLRQTHMFDLLQAIMSLIQYRRADKKGELSFAHQDVLKVLNNPYIKADFHHKSEQYQKSIRKKNLVYISSDTRKDWELPPILDKIFSPPPFPSDQSGPVGPFVQYFREIIEMLMADAQHKKKHLEAEYIFQFYKEFNRLEEVLERYQPQLSPRGFARLFREVLQKVRIPFEGEPLTGVQLMGFLETRVLDFEKIYILACNEGNLPDTSTGNSFIPYNLRKGFGLPTYEEKDAIYAYHFYRLLQRAEEVHLVYNTVVNDSGGAKEVSRFIRQIREYFEAPPNMHLVEKAISTPAGEVHPIRIDIPADEQTRNILLQKYQEAPVNGDKVGYLSATAINTWLACRLNFYFRYVAQIKEEEEVEESMDARTLGTILHNSLEFLHTPFIDKALEDQDFDAMVKQYPAHLQAAFREENLGPDLQGKNYLLGDVISRLAKDIIKQDKQGEKFRIRSLEDDQTYLYTLETKGYNIRINGSIDRLDQMTDSGVYRILDYKTGKVDLPDGKKPIEDILELCFEKGKYKQAVQGLLYAWLFYKQNPTEAAAVGFYPARKLKSGIQYLREGLPIPEDWLVAFEKALKEVIPRILEEPYTQTEDDQKCRTCPYKRICNRG